MNKLDILVFAAHPDDVELACSGTVLKHISLGYKVGIVDLTKGELGTRGSAAIRSEETKVASELLGIHIRENLGFRDGFFEIDEVHLLKVVEVIRKYQPEIILANAASDRHPDHKRAGDLVSRANFLSGLLKVQTENQTHWRAKAVYRYIQDNYMEPDFVVDISGFETKKLDAIKAFKSQFYDPNSNEPSTPISREDFLEFVLARAKQFGRPINAEYGEGFTVERYIGVDNLLSLK
ncbi:MAG: bacillithiol biosynthesis deacetylase BshB1 [Chitinophagales bacterium]|jgi:bacillithiol biosynthesis deacetylase BshB1|nr:bacillithiol biosynthesis deacetylase BshB1 [Chitinophagales bacterium]